MEYDYGTRLRVPDRQFQALLFRYSPVEVISQNTPENKEIALPQQEVLRGGEFPVGRSEQPGPEQGFTPGHVFDVSGRWSLDRKSVV